MSSSVTEDELEILKTSWIEQQEKLKNSLLVNDVEEWQCNRTLKLVGGMDLSFSKQDPSQAICTLVICSIPDLQIVHEESLSVTLTVPYVPGFLAFREVEPCLTLHRRLKENHPEIIPQVILFDGNGVLHPRGLGLASHFGILADVCTVGVAKNLYQMGSVVRDKEHLSRVRSLKEPGDTLLLDDHLGVALKTSKGALRPVYVSVGHKIALETAVWVVMQCVGSYRIPEPTRQADIRSRTAIRTLDIVRKECGTNRLGNQIT